MVLKKYFRVPMLLFLVVLLMFSTTGVLANNETITDIENVALNKPATSTTVEGNHPALHAVDGRTDTYWASKNPSELEIDLEKYYDISKINLMAYFDTSTNAERSYEYVIYAGKDKDSYVKVAEKNDSSYETSLGTDFIFNDDIFTARYIKVTILKTSAVGQPSNNTGHIKELSVYGKLSSEQPAIKTNVALNKSATASGQESNTQTADRAIDGDTGSKWAVAGPGWIEIDLEGYYDVDEINVLPYYADKRYYHYEIYTSVDGINYKKIGEKKDDTLQTSEGDTYTFSKITIRYVKVKMLKNSANPSMHLNELRVYGIENKDFIPPEEEVDSNHLAYNKPARSYSNTEKNPVSNINDGKLSTTWTALYYPAYVDIDLEKNYNLDQIKVFPEFKDAEVYYQYSIFTSIDGVTFDQVAQKQNKDKVTAEGDTFGINGKEARIVRIFLEYCSVGNTGSFAEVKVYGKDSGTAIVERPEIKVTDFKNTEYANPITEKETLESVRGVLERVIGKKYQDWFEFVLEENSQSNNDYYEISNHNGKIQIKGNAGVSLTAGLNYYLKYYCNVSISQQSRQVNMPKEIVTVDKVIRKETPYEVRYAYNYCTHSYSMAFWGETEWQNELDWQALNGYNAILDITGQEEVWRRFLGEIGYSDDEAKDWLVGPSYYGWQYMANMENVNGPIPDSWFPQRTELARKNQRQMRALGMTPVLQGYSGMVPNSLNSKDPDAQIIEQGLWNGMQRPAMLKTDTQTYRDYAERFYRIQKDVFGNISNYYATDPFHEGGQTGGVSRDVVGREVLSQMQKADPNCIWMIQSWSFNPELIAKITPEEKTKNLMILDLNSTKNAKYQSMNEFDGTNWVYCILENYGGGVGISGSLEKISKVPSKIKDKYTHMKGMGITPEGTLSNPIKYDLIAEVMWSNIDIDLVSWTNDYVTRRYGAKSENAQKAWELMLQTAYSQSSSPFDPPETIFNARPRFGASSASPNATNNIHYDKVKFQKALDYLMKDYDILKNSECYLYDVTDILRQALGNSGKDHYQAFVDAFNAGDRGKFKAESQKFIEMVKLQEKILGANKSFLLGTWMKPAITASVELDDFSKKIFKLNSKALITTWAPYYAWGVYDYANRQYSDITTEYYLKRWEIWIQRLDDKLNGKKVDNYNQISTAESHQFAWEWARSDKEYTTQESGEDLKELYRIFKSKYSVVETNLDQTKMLVSTNLGDMEEMKSYPLKYVSDANKSTFWSTKNGVTQDPIEVYFELDKPTILNSFKYTARQDGGYDGTMTRFELYGSIDGKEYTKITTGKCELIKTEQVTKFDNQIFKYVKLAITDMNVVGDYQKRRSVSAAEFNFGISPSTLSSDLYTVDKDIINKVKENTTIKELLNALNIPEDGVVTVERDGKILGEDDIVVENDVVRLVINGIETDTCIIGKIEKQTDFTELNKLIADCQDLIKNDYTSESWKVFEDVLTIVIGVQVSPSATQAEVDSAFDNLQKAYQDLVPIIIESDKLALSIVIDMAKEVTPEQLDKVVPVVVNEFKASLQNAKTVYAKSNATQEEVDNAFDRLAKVMQMLEFYKGDKIALQKMMNQIAGLSTNDYTETSWNALQAVLPNVNEVLGNENAMQGEIDEMYTELLKAFINLRLKPNKDLLNDLINRVNGINRANYTTSSLKLIDDELQKANAVFNNPNATEDEITNAVNGLTRAISGLVERNPVVDNNANKPTNTVKPGDTKVNATKTGDTTNIMYSLRELIFVSTVLLMNKKRRINKA